MSKVVHIFLLGKPYLSNVIARSVVLHYMVYKAERRSNLVLGNRKDRLLRFARNDAVNTTFPCLWQRE